jgi:hypothetical protein
MNPLRAQLVRNLRFMRQQAGEGDCRGTGREDHTDCPPCETVRLLAAPELGEFGLPYDQVGGVVQSMLVVLEDRGFRREHILEALNSFDESMAWDRFGEVIDELEDTLGLTSDAESEGGA